MHPSIAWQLEHLHRHELHRLPLTPANSRPNGPFKPHDIQTTWLARRFRIRRGLTSDETLLNLLSDARLMSIRPQDAIACMHRHSTLTACAHCSAPCYPEKPSISTSQITEPPAMQFAPVAACDDTPTSEIRQRPSWRTRTVTPHHGRQCNAGSLVGYSDTGPPSTLRQPIASRAG
jgi:hypothetical protein